MRQEIEKQNKILKIQKNAIKAADNEFRKMWIDRDEQDKRTTQQIKRFKELEEALELKQKQLNEANANTSEANNNTKLANERLEQVKQFATQLADANTELKNENERQRAEIEKQSENIEACKRVNEVLAEQFVRTNNQIITAKDAEIERLRQEIEKQNKKLKIQEPAIRLANEEFAAQW